jgi:redox-sensitive bicupin YhaK (pirin superfamily)
MIQDPSPLPNEVEAVIVPRAHDVGGFEVHRALPAREKQMIGPFIFFDQMGPSSSPARASTSARIPISVWPP